MTRIRARFLFAVLAAAPFGFAQRGPIDQQLTFTPYHASGIYDAGETVGWAVAPGPVTPTYAYRWTIRRNNAVVLKEGKLDLSSGKDKIEITGDQPEMIYVAVEPFANLAPPTPDAPGAAPAYTGGNTGRNNGLYAVGAAVAPAKIGLSTPRPDDFDAFWQFTFRTMSVEEIARSYGISRQGMTKRIERCRRLVRESPEAEQLLAWFAQQ